MIWNGFSLTDRVWLSALWRETLSGMFEAGEMEIASEADVIILNWLHEEKTVSYQHQVELLDGAAKHGTPVLIFDQNGSHEEGSENDPLVELSMFESVGIPMKLTMPAFFPLERYETLHIPYPFERGRNKPFHTNRLYKRSYVGWKDERYGQALEWYRGNESDIWGNWLEESPEQTLMDFEVGPRFHDECPQDKVQTVMQRSIATCHLGTPEQCSLGMLTLRYAEAAEAGCLAFVPWEMQLPAFWRNVFTSEEEIWKMDLEADTNHTEKYLLSEMQNQQQLLIQEGMSHYAWAKVIADLAEERK
jgi:hypothetical protein